MTDHSGRIALVTGAARRIGRAIVEDLVAHGFAVVIHCDTSQDEAGSLARQIGDAGGRAAVVSADLTDSPALDRVIAEAASHFGPPDILVNNASLFEPDLASDFDWTAWDRHFAIHLKAPAMLTRLFAETLPADRDGLVVNMVDQRVLRPAPRFFSYALSKSALWEATRMMAQTYAPRIRVNALAPGPTLANARQSAADFAAQVRSVPLRRGPSLGEFGAAIRYLWDSRSITGQMIALDGGQHLSWQTPDMTGNE